MKRLKILQNTLVSPLKLNGLNRFYAILFCLLFISFSSCKNDDDKNMDETEVEQEECECIRNGAELSDKELTQTIVQDDNKIEIYVEASNLWNSDYPAITTDVDNFTAIASKGQLSSYRKPKKDFTTNVGKGKKIIWTISDQSDKKEYKTQLVSINMKQNQDNINFFDEDHLVIKKNKIEARTKNFPDGDPEDYIEYEYYITFSLMDCNGETRIYNIDPKLRMQSSTNFN